MATEEQTKIKLHWLDGSRAQGVLWLLEELNVPYELDIHHREKTMLAPPALQKIHPLGKSPLVSMTLPGASEPVVLAESAFIVSYLADHWGQGKNLVPPRWKEGQEGKVGGETEAWMRYQYLLYYTEGSLMPYLFLYLVISSLKGPQVPWLLRLITSMIADKIISVLVFPNVQRNLTLLEGFLSSAPSTGKYMCGDHLTAADILVSYPLMAAKDRTKDMGKFEKGTPEATYPKLFEYIDRIAAEPGYKKSADKIREIEGTFYVVPRQPS